MDKLSSLARLAGITKHQNSPTVRLSQVRETLLGTFYLFVSLGWSIPQRIEVWVIVSAFVAAVMVPATMLRRLLSALSNYQLTHGTMDGYSYEDTFASDLEETFVAEMQPEQALAQLSSTLSALTETYSIKCDVQKGELRAVARRLESNLPVDIFVRVQPKNRTQTTVAVRTLAPAADLRPDCFFMNKLLLKSVKSMSTESTELPVAKHRWYRPKSMFLPIACLALTMGLSTATTKVHESEITQSLIAQDYSSALSKMSKLSSDAVDSKEKYEALLGTGKYAEAVALLDPKVDQEFIALSKACQGNFSEAEQWLGKIPPGDQTMDVGARYLAESMVLAHRGQQAKALDSLAIATDAATTLHTFAEEQESKLLRSLGASEQADEIAAQRDLKLTDARSELSAYAPSFMFPLYAISMLLLYFGLSLFSHRLYHKKPAGFPELEPEPHDVVADLEHEAALDRCLYVLTNKGFTMINLNDDGAGIVEAVDSQGAHLILKLATEDNGGTKISLQSAALQKTESGRKSLEELAMALSS